LAGLPLGVSHPESFEIFNNKDTFSLAHNSRGSEADIIDNTLNLMVIKGCFCCLGYSQCVSCSGGNEFRRCAGDPYSNSGNCIKRLYNPQVYFEENGIGRKLYYRYKVGGVEVCIGKWCIGKVRYLPTF